MTARAARAAPTDWRALRLPGRILRAWPRVLAMVLCLAAEAARWVVVPVAVQHLIDRGLVASDPAVVRRTVLAMAVIVTVGTAAGVAYEWLSGSVVAEFVRQLRSDLFEQLQQRPHSWHRDVDAGDVLTIFSTDLGAVEEAARSLLPWVALPLMTALGAVVAVAAIDPRLLLLVALVVPFTALGPRLMARPTLQAIGHRRAANGATQTQLKESLETHVVVRAYGLQDRVRRRFDAAANDLEEATARAAFLGGALERSSGLGAAVLQILVLTVGASMAAAGTISIGQLAGFQALFLVIVANVDYIVQFTPQLVRSMASLAPMAELLAAAPGVADAHDAGVASFTHGLEFEQVTFGYDAERPVVRDVSLRIGVGQSVAFVGPSGCGKSTLLNLLLRFDDPDVGRIVVDGADLRSLQQDTWRALTAVVLQDTVLFDDTLGENIRLGRSSASDSDVEAAARAADLHDWVSTLPDGYATAVGPRGSRLSGGQRQRVGLARALLRDAPILVLDEATSALDASAEAAVNATIARVAAERTVVSVTHRLASVVSADLIVVLDGGRVVEQGRHGALVAADGVYADLWARQSGFRVGPDGDVVGVTGSRLAQIPALAGLAADVLDDLAGRVETHHLRAGRVVFEAGDRGEGMFVVVRGRLTVERPDTLDPPPVLRDGDVFGEMALLSGAPRNATVRTEAPTTLLSLSRLEFLRALDADPALRASFDSIAASRAGGDAPRPTQP